MEEALIHTPLDYEQEVYSLDQEAARVQMAGPGQFTHWMQGENRGENARLQPEMEFSLGFLAAKGKGERGWVSWFSLLEEKDRFLKWHWFNWVTELILLSVWERIRKKKIKEERKKKRKNPFFTTLRVIRGKLVSDRARWRTPCIQCSPFCKESTKLKALNKCWKILDIISLSAHSGLPCRMANPETEPGPLCFYSSVLAGFVQMSISSSPS